MAESNARNLFPNLFKTSGVQNSSRTYQEIIHKRLREKAYAVDDLINDKRIAPGDDEAIRSAVRKVTTSVWVDADKEFAKSILDGTVDSFPPLLIWDGAGISKKLVKKDTGETYLELPGAVAFVDVDYFESAKTAIEAAKRYDPLVLTETKDKYQIVRYSKLCLALRSLYAYKRSKFPRRNLLIQRFFRCILLFVIGVLALTGIRALFYRHLDSQSLRTFLASLAIVLVLLILFTIYRFCKIAPEIYRSFVAYKKSLKNMRAIMTLNKVGVIASYPDAKKLLLFYKLWQSHISDAVKKGYRIQGPNDSDKTSDVQDEMNEVISEMENIISYIENNFRERSFRLQKF